MTATQKRGIPNLPTQRVFTELYRAVHLKQTVPMLQHKVLNRPARVESAPVLKGVACPRRHIVAEAAPFAAPTLNYISPRSVTAIQVAKLQAPVSPAPSSNGTPSAAETGSSSMHTANLLLKCPDQKGVIAAVSQVRCQGVRARH